MARYDSMRKLERNKMLREYAKAHPELSLKEIGRAFNISESRVWRILHNNKTGIGATAPIKDARISINQGSATSPFIKGNIKRTKEGESQEN